MTGDGSDFWDVQQKSRGRYQVIQSGGGKKDQIYDQMEIPKVPLIGGIGSI